VTHLQPYHLLELNRNGSDSKLIETTEQITTAQLAGRAVYGALSRELAVVMAPRVRAARLERKAGGSYTQPYYPSGSHRGRGCSELSSATESPSTRPMALGIE
jgi:hypothetical protein